MPTHLARGQISSREDRRIDDDCDVVEGGGKVKNWQGEIWAVPSDHNTTRIFEGPREKNFQKKKLAGEDPLDPLPLILRTTFCLIYMAITVPCLLSSQQWRLYFTSSVVSQSVSRLVGKRMKTAAL